MSLADFKTPDERRRLLHFRALLHVWERLALQGPEAIDAAALGLTEDMLKLLPVEWRETLALQLLGEQPSQQPVREAA